MKHIVRIFCLTLIVALSSCSINKDLMFKTPTKYEYDVPPEVMDLEYRIQIHDLLIFRLYSNNGFKLIDITTGNSGSSQEVRNLQNTIRFKVEIDGTVKFPTIGHVPIKGLTIREAELFLEEKYANYYVEPFAMLEVTNNRVIVMPGSGGDARVITLTNDNTTIMEALAQAGGVAQRGNSSKIKLIRLTDEGRKVYALDMSTIDGVKNVDMIVQAQDIIYVEPTPQIASEILRDLAPVFAIITSMVVLLNLVQQ
jgi:polysaccharide export outer membrane protein